MDQVSDGARPVGSAGRWRWLGYAALAGVLALAFWGYTTPEMMLNWENLMALCGFG
jgi:hypothetical protein